MYQIYAYTYTVKIPVYRRTFVLTSLLFPFRFFVSRRASTIPKDAPVKPPQMEPKAKRLPIAVMSFSKLTSLGALGSIGSLDTGASCASCFWSGLVYHFGSVSQAIPRGILSFHRARNKKGMEQFGYIVYDKTTSESSDDVKQKQPSYS